MPLTMSQEVFYVVRSSEEYLIEQRDYWKQSVEDWTGWIDQILWDISKVMVENTFDNEALDHYDERLEKCFECHAAAANRVKLYELALILKRKQAEKAA